MTQRHWVRGKEVPVQRPQHLGARSASSALTLQKFRQALRSWGVRSQERRTSDSIGGLRAYPQISGKYFPTEPKVGHGITRGSDGFARPDKVDLDASPKNNVDVFYSVISNTLDLWRNSMLELSVMAGLREPISKQSTRHSRLRSAPCIRHGHWRVRN